MHTLHLPETPVGGIKYAALGILFSVNKPNIVLDPWQTKVIDDFFDQLEWTTTDSNPTVDEVSYGKLMNMVDFDERWVYKGSVTTPPCDTLVYWNVLRTIYPIK